MSAFEPLPLGAASSRAASSETPTEGSIAEPCWREVVRSEQLMHGNQVLHIEHNGALYQLRATRLGKLILTK
jgi:hemin uptake protein HemP